MTDVQFFAGDPFNTAYFDALRDDLREAEWVRFLMCYLNEDGANALSRDLARALTHPESKGLITLTCACGVKGLQLLWERAGRPRNQLKCFMPMKREGSADAKLLHSKMVVLFKPGRRGGAPRIVLYTGSHNWTGPGLRLPGRGDGRLNVEASLRLEADWDPSSPEMAPFFEALRQIDVCFDLASSTDLGDPAAEAEIESWLRAKCKKDIAAPGSMSFIVASGVLTGRVDAASARSGQPIPRRGRLVVPKVGQSLYVQHFNYRGEPETFDSAPVWALLLWEQRADLAAAEQPWLVLCRPRNLGQSDAGSPNLQAIDWLVYDPRHNSSAAVETEPPESVTVPATVLRTGKSLEVEHWCVAPVQSGTPTQALNHRTPDRYALLEVAAVRRPNRREVEGAVWAGTELPFHQGKNRTPLKGFVVHDPDGRPSMGRADRMRDEQRTLFGLTVDAGGPTGDPRLLEHDVFPCQAPVNEVLFAGRAQGTRIDDPHRERTAWFEVPVDPDLARARSKRVARMERLIAPGRPHIERALGLSEVELDALGWKP